MKKLVLMFMGLLVCGSAMATTFYLQADMQNDAAQGNPENKDLWFDAPAGGSTMTTLAADFAGNLFDFNGYRLRSPNPDLGLGGTNSFGGTFVVDAAAPTGYLLCPVWTVDGLDVSTDYTLYTRLENTFGITNMNLSSGSLLIRNPSSDDHFGIDMDVQTLTGAGTLQLGSITGDDTAAWNLSVADASSAFSGEILVVRGQLSLDSALSLSNATLSVTNINSSATVVVDASVTFGSVQVGSAQAAPGTYTPIGLNVELGAPRFSGAGSITVLTGPAPTPSETFYLQGDMPTSPNPVPEDPSWWWDAPTGGSQMVGSFAGNLFDLNGYLFKTKNTLYGDAFAGTLVKDDEAINLYAVPWTLGGLDVTTNAVTANNGWIMQKDNMDISVTSLNLDGDLLIRAGTSQRNLDLSVMLLTGSGELAFGRDADETNHVWGLEVIDTASAYSGTINVKYGDLRFDNALSLEDAQLELQSTGGSVILSNSVTFGAMVYEATQVEVGMYTAAQLNSELGTDRFVGAGTITVLTDNIATFYLHTDMTTASDNNSPLLKTIWWTDPVGGVTQDSLGAPTTGNRFNLNGYILRSPSSAGASTFPGTFVVGTAGAGLAELLAATWNVAGMQIDNAVQMRLRQSTVNLNVMALELGASGVLKFRTLTGNNNLNLLAADCSGGGTLEFGDSTYANDVNGVWSFDFTAHTFEGTVSLVRGQLNLDSALVMNDAAFEIDSAEDNSVVIANNMTFGSMTYGVTEVADGEYDAATLNSDLGTTRFSGTGTLIVGVSAASPYADWLALYELAGANTNMTADVEPDGMDNLIEYALGGNPTNDDAVAILPVSSVEGGWLTYTYNRRDDAGDRGLTYTVVSDTDLVTGAMTNEVPDYTVSAPSNGFETVTSRIAIDSADVGFMKLNIELAE